MLGDYNKVTVSKGSVSNGKNCAVKRCKCKDVYMIFADDGNTSMSRHYAQSCKKHLSKLVDAAWNFNDNLKKIKEQNNAIQRKML